MKIFKLKENEGPVYQAGIRFGQGTPDPTQPIGVLPVAHFDNGRCGVTGFSLKLPTESEGQWVNLPWGPGPPSRSCWCVVVGRRALYSGRGHGPPSARGAGARLGSREGSWARGQGRCALRARCHACCPPGTLVFRGRLGGSWCCPTSHGVSGAAVEGREGAERWRKGGDRTRLVLERRDGDPFPSLYVLKRGLCSGRALTCPRQTLDLDPLFIQDPCSRPSGGSLLPRQSRAASSFYKYHFP